MLCHIAFFSLFFFGIECFSTERIAIPKEKRITSHGLRHSHASYLLMRGRGIKYISKRLGHKNASITLDVYSHVIDRMQEIEDSAMVSDLDTLNMN